MTPLQLARAPACFKTAAADLASHALTSASPLATSPAAEASRA